MAIAAATRDFTGSEIAALVPDALFAAFGDGERDITTADLLTAARSVVPLAQTAADKIGALREWAKTRARPASLPEQAQASQRRALDL
jgi:SpoVK/Ycf46/Vps4 family AAA+-type ATPase